MNHFHSIEEFHGIIAFYEFDEHVMVPQQQEQQELHESSVNRLYECQPVKTYKDHVSNQTCLKLDHHVVHCIGLHSGPGGLLHKIRLQD